MDYLLFCLDTYSTVYVIHWLLCIISFFLWVTSPVPVHKKGITTDVSNNHPISLTCVLSKILERIVVGRLSDHGFINIAPLALICLNGVSLCNPRNRLMKQACPTVKLLQSESGRLLTEDPDIMMQWQENCEHLYSSSKETEKMTMGYR